MKFNIETDPFLSKINSSTYNGNLKIQKVIVGAFDRNWIKEYEHFYSKQPFATPYVKRIFLKDGKSKGFCHIRSISDSSRLSETYLSPPNHMTARNKYYLKCLGKYSEYGHKIKCVPYIMPETVFGMCIHASIWICLKILENMSNGEVKIIDIPKIQTLATGHPFTDKEGLPFRKTTRMLRMCNTNAFYISNVNQNNRFSDDEMLSIIYAYVESGLPVIIGADTKKLPWCGTSESEYHTIVAIGHTMNNDDVDGFIFHDESFLPYQVLTNQQLLDAWRVPLQHTEGAIRREAVVAVPPIVNSPYELVYRAGEYRLNYSIDNNLIDFNKNLPAKRIFLEHASIILQKETPEIVREIFRHFKTPPYIWIVHKKSDNKKIITYSDGTPFTNSFVIYYKSSKEEKAFYYEKEKIYRAYWKDKTVKIEELEELPSV